MIMFYKLQIAFSFILFMVLISCEENKTVEVASLPLTLDDSSDHFKLPDGN